MKNLILILISFLTLIACLEKDVEYQVIVADDEGDSVDVSTKTYLPLNLQNNWVYLEEGTNETIETTFSGLNVINNIEYNSISNPNPLFGNADEANVRIENSKYYFTGNIQFPQNLQFPDIEIEELVFLDENASDGDLVGEFGFISTIPGIPVDFNGIEIMVTPEFELKINVVQTETFPTLLVSDVNYEDCLIYNWTYLMTIKLKFSTSAPIQIEDHILLPEDEVGGFEVTYANEIGVVSSTFYLLFQNLEFNTTVNTPTGPIDISGDLEGFINSLNNATVINDYLLTDYGVIL